MNELIKELREWWSAKPKGNACFEYKMQWGEKFNEILSRHEQERGDGLREAYSELRNICEEFVYKCAHGMAKSSKTYGKMKSALSTNPTHKQKQYHDVEKFFEDEPTPSKPEVEPLACLADRKGWYIQGLLPPVVGRDVWDIEMRSKNKDPETVEYSRHDVDGPTYPAAEQAARRFLEGLEDVKI